jgi:hypothetical protein
LVVLFICYIFAPLNQLNQLTMTTFLSNQFIEEHIKLNSSLKDYEPYLNFNKHFQFVGLKLIVNVNEIINTTVLVKMIEKNLILSKQYIHTKLNIKTPSIGDYVKIGDDYVRLTLKIGDEFQYSNDGSIYLSNDSASYSGGFEFKYGNTIKLNQLSQKPIDKKIGTFWFFSNNNVTGSNGVYFKDEFKVWEYLQV